jgi:hypothetical protein
MMDRDPPIIRLVPLRPDTARPARDTWLSPAHRRDPIALHETLAAGSSPEPDAVDTDYAAAHADAFISRTG